MASTNVRVRLPLADTANMTLELYPEAGGAIVNGAGDTLTQVDGDDPFFYETTVTEALAGNYQWVIKLSGGTHAAFGPALVRLADDAGPYYLESDIPLFTTRAIDGKSVEEALKIIAATTAGVSSGAGTGTETFKGLDGTTTRVTGTVDDDSNRTAVNYS